MDVEAAEAGDDLLGVDLPNIDWYNAFFTNFALLACGYHCPLRMYVHRNYFLFMHLEELLGLPFNVHLDSNRCRCKHNIPRIPKPRHHLRPFTLEPMHILQSQIPIWCLCSILPQHKSSRLILGKLLKVRLFHIFFLL